ncbi:MAG: LOG family protein [Phycisphaerae bacterium]|nr:LOG family protein [Phycisphaerae bacterium]
MPIGAEKKIVTIFGSGDPLEGSDEYALAETVGAKLAALGYTIANGGYRGTMEASARGARKNGGEVVGVSCSIWNSAPNDYITRGIVTKNYDERLSTLIDIATCGFVTLPGGTGTLVELSMVWEAKSKGFWKNAPEKPIVCMGNFWAPLVDMMASQRPDSKGFVSLLENPEKLSEIFPAL